MTAMKRDVTVTTNLGADVLLCARMDGTEEMSRPFEYVVDLLTQQEDIELHKLVGQPMTVHLTIAEGKTRYFNGLVSRVAFTGSEGDYHTYRATVRPWLWTLTRRTDCRVFQDVTVPDIVKEVFRDAGFSDFEEKLSGDYLERGYCVQYRETDFDFVSRLLEEEGIYYYFLHEDGKQTLLLADSINAHAPFDGHADMKFFPPGRTETLEEPHIFDWEVSHEYRSNIFAQNDYDFTEPTKDLATNASIPRDQTRADTPTPAPATRSRRSGSRRSRPVTSAARAPATCPGSQSATCSRSATTRAATRTRSTWCCPAGTRCRSGRTRARARAAATRRTRSASRCSRARRRTVRRGSRRSRASRARTPRRSWAPTARPCGATSTAASRSSSTGTGSAR